MYDPRAIADDLDDLLKSGFGPNAAATELDCLALATCYDRKDAEHAAHAKLAKKVLKKHASAPVKAALSKVTRRNYYPKAHTTHSVFEKETERLQDVTTDLAQIAGFDHLGYAGRIVALAPPLLNNLLARRDLAFLDAYFRDAHPRDELTLEDVEHPGGYRYRHSFTRAELEVLARIPRFTRVEFFYEGKGYPLPADMSAWTEMEVLQVISEAPAAMKQPHADALGALPKLRELRLRIPLESMPKDLSSWSELFELHLHCTHLTELPDAFSSLTGLRLLEVRWASKMKTIRDGVGGMKALEVLRLSGVNLDSCSERLGELTNLRELTIKGSEEIADVFAVLGRLTSLERLTLENMKCVVALPDVLGELTNLRELTIKDMDNFTTWFSGLENLTSLVELRLVNLGWWSQGPKEMIEGVGALEHLEVLDLSKTKIGDRFPDEVLSCPRLRVLRLEACYTGAPPDGIGALTELEELDLRSIAIESYPSTFFELRKLRRLHMGGHGGYAPDLPDEVRNFTELELLDLNSARITGLPEGICGLEKLKWLELEFNPLKGFPENFTQLTNLEHVAGTGSRRPEIVDRLEELQAEMPWCSFWNFC
jgi:Leucine-rich repeat (LRR) protein